MNKLNTTKAKKIRKIVRGERGYLLSILYVDARKNKPILMPTAIFNIFFDYCFLGDKSWKVNLILFIFLVETIITILFLRGLVGVMVGI